MNLPVSTSDEEIRRVPSSRDTDLQVTSDRVELTVRQRSDLGDRAGVGFAFAAAGMTGGLAFLLAAGAWYDLVFGLACILAGLFSGLYYWTRPPIERTLTIDAEGVTDVVNEGDGLDRQRMSPSQIGDVVMRPVTSDRGDMYRVELELSTDRPGYDTHPILETADWEEAKQLVDELQKRLPE